MDERADQLERRVRWLDRQRRRIAILLGVGVACFVAHEIAQEMGDDWPQIHITIFSVMVGIIGWLVVELALASLTALWETEHVSLQRTSRGLPRAALLRRRK